MNITKILQENKRNFEKFHTKFPNLLSDIDPYYFDAPKGWHSILNELFTFLEDRGVRAIQVKQKFGELRVYLTGDVSLECPKIVSRAEELSRTTCEECGSMERVSLVGEMVGKGLIKQRRLCRECV